MALPAIGTRERDSMLKLIWAMACHGYGCKSGLKRSDTVQKLMSALALTGLQLSDDTVRRHLKAAEERLPE